jgi:hypothetical protein
MERLPLFMDLWIEPLGKRITSSDKPLARKKLANRSLHEPCQPCMRIMFSERFHGRNGHEHVTKGAQAYGQDTIGA